MKNENKKYVSKHILDQIKDTDLSIQDKNVNVMSGNKILHTGIVLGEDKIMGNVFVGLTSSSLSHDPLLKGQKFISIFRTNIKKIKLA
jgi:hypothetical protein